MQSNSYSQGVRALLSKRSPEIMLLFFAFLEENVAFQRKTIQSSTFDGKGVANNAVDGNRNKNYYSNSCSATRDDLDPWWRLDLEKPYKISSITITNREDCCPGRLQGAVIHIGNSLENEGNDNPVCGTVSLNLAEPTQTFCCKGMKGRYISIQIPGRKEYLTLCEVEVMGVPGEQKCLQLPDEINVAIGGEATQVSKFDVKGDAGNAINGDKNTNYFSGSCTLTNNDFNPWWKLDLKKAYNISTIIITNRGDCCSERLEGASVHVGYSRHNNGKDNPLCGIINSVMAGSIETFCCNGMDGRYVTIHVPERREYLSLCEVEVFGVPANVLEDKSCF
nr:PREDICTED: pentraxin fusion protein-like [Latimeria chalumnae]|eukprot:XP_014354454.1 PREDICTED: pentraxin fusion protein-like [Latimeria chalumnae]